MAALVASGALVAGCSNDDTISSKDLQDALAKAGSGVSGSSVPSDGELPAPVTGASPSEIRARFDAAMASGDFCAFLTELDNVVTDLNDPVAVVAAYGQLRDSVSSATPLVPGELTDPWAVLVGATERAAASVERSEGDPNDKSLEGVFTDPEVDGSIDTIFAYEDRACRSAEASSTTTTATTGT